LSPTPRAAGLLGLVAVSALVLPFWLVVAGGVALAVAMAVDFRAVRRRPEVERKLPSALSRGVGVPLAVDAFASGVGGIRIRQASPPALELSQAESEGALRARLTPLRRGRHRLPPVAVRIEGPLGLASRYLHDGQEAELLVYPDLPAARRLALAVRHGFLRDPGLRARGPLGLGTDFESIRDYQPDDDVRQVNWRATARLGRPMSNQYRVEKDRDVICLIDCGRLMAAALGGRSRLDAALDAAAAVALVADELGDRCGALAFDDRIRRLVAPRRYGAQAVIRHIFDVDASSSDSDYELAFRSVEGAKRALVLVLTDLIEETAARPLVEAVPVLARRHAVTVASAEDPDLNRAVRSLPDEPRDAYRMAVALDVLAARSRATALLRGTGATVVEAPPAELGVTCVRAYLQAKARARL